MNHPESNRKVMIPMFVRRTISPSVNEEILQGELRAAMNDRQGGLFGEFKDSDLHEFCDGEVLEAAILHAANEVRRDFEDTDLNEFIERRLISESANLLDFVGIDSLDFERDELVGVGKLVAH